MSSFRGNWKKILGQAKKKLEAFKLIRVLCFATIGNLWLWRCLKSWCLLCINLTQRPFCLSLLYILSLWRLITQAKLSDKIVLLWIFVLFCNEFLFCLAFVSQSQMCTEASWPMRVLDFCRCQFTSSPLWSPWFTSPVSNRFKRFCLSDLSSQPNLVNSQT